MSIELDVKTNPKKETILQVIKKFKCRNCRSKLKYRGMRMDRDKNKTYVFVCPRCFMFWFYDVERKHWEKDRELRMKKGGVK